MAPVASLWSLHCVTETAVFQLSNNWCRCTFAYSGSKTAAKLEIHINFHNVWKIVVLTEFFFDILIIFFQLTGFLHRLIHSSHTVSNLPGRHRCGHHSNYSWLFYLTVPQHQLLLVSCGCMQFLELSAWWCPVCTVSLNLYKYILISAVISWHYCLKLYNVLSWTS